MENDKSYSDMVNNTTIPIDKSNGNSAMIIWHLNGITESFALNKNIDMMFDDKAQKFRYVNGYEK